MGLLIIPYLIGHRLEALLLLEISHVFFTGSCWSWVFVKLPSTHFLNFIYLVCCCFILSVLETFFALKQCSLSSWVRLLSLGKAIVMGLCLVCDNGYHPQKYQEPSVPTENWVTKKWQALFTSLVCLAWSHKWQNNKKTNETSLLQQT